MTRRNFGQAALAGVVLVMGMGLSLIQPERSAATVPAKAYFAGGCFWCMEEAFEKVEGVLMAVSGYMDGTVANPTYEQVSAGGTGHAESVEVTYDPAKVSYQQLLDYYWVHIDPFDPIGQFCDKGHSYMTAIFVASPEEQELAEQSLQQVAAQFPNQKVATQILAASTFYPIKGEESYHQDYYKKNPVRYKFYRTTCGRDQRLEEVWGDKAGH